MGAMSSDRLMLYDVKYLNYLTLNLEKRGELIEKCKKMKEVYDNETGAISPASY